VVQNEVAVDNSDPLDIRSVSQPVLAAEEVAIADIVDKTEIGVGRFQVETDAFGICSAANALPPNIDAIEVYLRHTAEVNTRCPIIFADGGPTDAYAFNSITGSGVIVKGTSATGAYSVIRVEEASGGAAYAWLRKLRAGSGQPRKSTLYSELCRIV
jgi:hypothetical protein